MEACYVPWQDSFCVDFLNREIKDTFVFSLVFPLQKISYTSFSSKFFFLFDIFCCFMVLYNFIKILIFYDKKSSQIALLFVSFIKMILYRVVF